MKEVTQQSAMNYLHSRVEQIAYVRYERPTYGYRPNLCKIIMDSVRADVPVPAFNPSEHTLKICDGRLGIEFYTQDKDIDTGKLIAPLKYVSYGMPSILDRIDAEYVRRHNIIIAHIEEMTQISIDEFTDGKIDYL